MVFSPLLPAVFPPVPAIETQPTPSGIPANRAATESFTNVHLPIRPSLWITGVNRASSPGQSIPARARVEATISSREIFALVSTLLINSSKLFPTASIPMRSQLAPPFAAVPSIFPSRSTKMA